MHTHPEYQYLELLRNLLDEGDPREDRTGVGTRALFGQSLRFDLSDGFPAFTTKQIFWKTAFKEMFWMLSGGRNIRELLEQNVRIWTDWPLKKFRASTGLPITQLDFETRILNDDEFAATWGDLGPVYGSQWRRWPTSDGREIDQISELCHKTYQFFVSKETGKLSSLLMQRSADAYLGLGWNIANLALLTHLLADQCGYLPGDIVWFGGDVHLYSNHVDQARLQISREPRALPRFIIKRKADTLFDYAIDDVDLEGYFPHPHIPADVAV
jgi:thymidylate synthase